MSALFKIGPRFYTQTQTTNAPSKTIISIFIKHSSSFSTNLAEVGRCEEPLSETLSYAPGQPFLHKIFGYRGVLLFPWHATVIDVDMRKQIAKLQRQPNLISPSTSSENNSENVTDDNKPSVKQSQNNNSNTENPIPPPQLKPSYSKQQYYYQALIDARDWARVGNRTQTEVLFCENPNSSRSVHSIRGFDYVAQDDVLPYTSHERLPIVHDLFNKFFVDLNTPNNMSKKLVPTEFFEGWKEKHCWLQLSTVYKLTTEGVRITVIPFYLGRTLVGDSPYHWWRYCVRMENLGTVSVKLRERHWKILGQETKLQTVKGRGVVGLEPELTKNEPAYQYSSHVNLQDSSGRMWGFFKMERPDGSTFECRIPTFTLESSLPVKKDQQF